MKTVIKIAQAFLMAFIAKKFTKLPSVLAGMILGIMFLFLVGSIWNEAATFDETAHIPAGFGYITQLDYRLNPEHPPLVKAISAGFAWVFARPYFSTDIPSWQNYVEGNWQQQFQHGHAFLYGFGNDADAVIFWSRVPIILMALGLGWMLFWWTRKRFGPSRALLVLSLYTLSPTVLAHGRLVTTDIAAALGFFMSIAAFISFLENPSSKKLLLAGAAFGIAQLLKYSLVLLIPMYAIILIGWIVSRERMNMQERIKLLAVRAGQSVGIGFVGLFVIWLCYGFFTLGYAPERQYRDMERTLASNSFRPGVETVLKLAQNPATRPLAQYFFGVLMVQQRAAGGNTTVFLGEVSSKGSPLYFPLLYLVKESLVLHILTVVALWFGIREAYRRKKNMFRMSRIQNWIKEHFVEFCAWTVIGIYWLISIRSPLNIGIRHVLPTFPFIYLLVSRKISDWVGHHDTKNPRTWYSLLKNMYQQYIASIPKFVFVTVLLLCMFVADAIVFPSFLSSYNLLGGGTKNGYTIAVDSNYDWGQDLKRLADFVEKNNIEHIALDYFGGGDPRYYMGQKYEPWWSAKGPAHGWFALSVSTREGAWGKIGPGFDRKPEDSYEWLKGINPVNRAGMSIIIYKLP